MLSLAFAVKQLTFNTQLFKPLNQQILLLPPAKTTNGTIIPPEAL